MVEVQDFWRKITHHFEGIFGIYLKFIKRNQKDHNMQCNQLDLETLESWPIMPKNLPDTLSPRGSFEWIENCLNECNDTKGDGSWMFAFLLLAHFS